MKILFLINGVGGGGKERRFLQLVGALKENPDMEIFTLPSCSPAYNPAEQVWRWLKPRVCSLPHLIFFDNSDRSAFRKTCHAS